MNKKIEISSVNKEQKKLLAWGRVNLANLLFVSSFWIHYAEISSIYVTIFAILIGSLLYWNAIRELRE